VLFSNASKTNLILLLIDIIYIKEKGTDIKQKLSVLKGSIINISIHITLGELGGAYP
jgi:hypothetical protein